MSRGTPARSGASSHEALLAQLGLHLQTPGRTSAPSSAARAHMTNGASTVRVTPMQFRSQRRPAFSPGSSVGDGTEQSDSDDYDQAAEDEQLEDPLDRSEELDADELRALIQTASSLTGLASSTPTKQTALVPSSSSNAHANVDAADLSNDELKATIASERAVLGDLMGKLAALQSQASMLKEMSERSRQAQAEMHALMEAGDANVEALEAEKRQLQEQLDQLQPTESEGDEDVSPSEDEDEESDADQDQEQNGDYPATSPEPSDSELEVEIERQPAESDEELETDARQLAQLEALMAELASTADKQRRAAARQAVSTEEIERQEEEAEVDERLFFGRESKQILAQAQQQAQAQAQAVAQGRAREKARGARYANADDQEERRQRAHRAASPSPTTSASPSPPRGSSRSKQTQSNAQNSSSTAAPTTSRVPNAVQCFDVPVSRWIGPSALPNAAPGGGSGRHAVYADRPATAVGTTRGAVRSGSGGRPQTAAAAVPVSWQAPTLSSLPASIDAKKSSLSSRSSLFVNAPESEVSSERSSHYRGSRPHPSRRGIAEEEVSEEEDAAALMARFDDLERRLQQQQPIESPLPSDSDSDLPFSINAHHQQQQAAAASRPKSARQAAPSHLNGRSSSTNNGAAHHRQQQAVSERNEAERELDSIFDSSYEEEDDEEDDDDYESIPEPTNQVTSQAAQAFRPESLSAADLQSVLAFIGKSLFVSSINVGNMGVNGAALGAGRLGAAQGPRTTQRQPQQQRTTAARAPKRTTAGSSSSQYGFAPAQPQAAWM